MAKSLSPTRRYVLAAGFGALAGGLLVVFVIGAVPRAISGLMAGMMKGMMARAEEGEGHLPDT